MPLEQAAARGDRTLLQTLVTAGGAFGTSLHEAICYGHAVLVKDLLKFGASPIAKDQHGNSPIHHAAALGRAGILRGLLSYGVDKNMRDRKGRTPLQLATIRGHLSVVQVLLEAGADASLRSGEKEESALDLAARGGHMAILVAMLHYGDNHAAALHEAARWNKAVTIKALVTARADAFVRNEIGHGSRRCSPHGSIQENAAVMLQCEAYINVRDKNRRTPLHTAVDRGNVSATIALLDAGADASLRFGDKEDSALDLAARNGDICSLSVMLKRGAYVHAARYVGTTALHAAAYGNHGAVLDVLIDAGVMVDARDKDGCTPLHTASKGVSPAAVLALLEYGAAVNATDADGRSPLHLAAARAGKHGASDTIDVLLRWGGDTTATTNSGRSVENVIGCMVPEDDRLEEDTNRVRKLLWERASSANSAWSRRRLYVLCRACRMRGTGPSSDSIPAHVMLEPRDRAICRTRRSKLRRPSEADDMDLTCDSGDEEGSSVNRRTALGPYALSGLTARIVGLEDDRVFRKIVGYL